MRLMHAASVPGLAVAVIRNGRISHLEAYGARDVSGKLPLRTDTVMYGASLTKATFAYMIMTLVDDGSIDLDKPVADYLPRPLPDYPEYADLAGDPRWREITPRMLLSHTSGFPNWRFYTARGVDEDGKLFINQEPGARYGYSGEGMQLLQFTLETGLKMDVGKLMQDRVFDRFGMARTSLTWRADFADNNSTGYDENGTGFLHDRQDNVRAAGSMDTTLADYARFLQGLLEGKGLSAASLNAMFTPQVAIHSVQQFPTQGMPETHDNDGIALSYGLGWGLFDSPLGKAFFKEGHNETTSNYVLCMRESKTCLLLLSNSANAEGIFKYIADRTLGSSCMPWYWENYIPYDHAEWRLPESLDKPHPPCATLH
ncbi:MAG: beta-lactamase family protein [Luteimonas sp.]|nr:beta-lactamase family protein [Luteimonas sp.]